MYLFGAEPFELMNCLKESQQKLIMAGAKADNLPKVPNKILHFLSALPPKAHSIVLTWFRTHVQFPEQGDPQKSFMRFCSQKITIKISHHQNRYGAQSLGSTSLSLALTSSHNFFAVKKLHYSIMMILMSPAIDYLSSQRLVLLMKISSSVYS